MAAARSLAERIATEAAPLSVSAVKEVVAATECLSIPEAYRLLASGELEHYERMLDSEDSREGARAFAEKRKPVWRGR